MASYCRHPPENEQRTFQRDSDRQAGIGC
jgi:hypothetical protein